MNTCTTHAQAERLVKKLEQHERYRVLRAVPKATFDMPPGPAPTGKCLALVDCETTGLDIGQNELIELAILLVWVNEAGEVIGHHKPLSWLREPQAPLELRIRQLTGLTDADLRGKSIDDNLACALLDRADLIIAHNAHFDRKWIERRYPQFATKEWACSANEVDWGWLGFDGRAQQHLLLQHGWFANAHRAGDDVWSLLHLLRQKRPEPKTGERRSHLSRLIEAAALITELVEATAAPFSRKDQLKARGYRWNAEKRVWCTEVNPDKLAAERAWFATNGLPPFRSQPLSASDRHR